MQTLPDVYAHIRIVISIVLGLGIARLLMDTRLKGSDYFRALGAEYPIRIACFVVLSAVAMFTRNRWYHGCFVAATLLSQFTWMRRQYLTP